MNESTFESIHGSPPKPTGDGDTSPSQVARYLRLLGAGAVLLSAVVYMLQGIDHIGAELRQWVYLALIAGLGGAGIACRTWFQDAIGARVCFALAGGALAVQVSQVAGMLHELLIAPTEEFWLSFAGTTATSTALTALATAVVFLPIAHTAFTILQRSAARALTLTFVVTNVMLLIPAREGLTGLITIAAIAASWLALEYTTLRHLPSMRTLEGLAARIISVLPVAIAFVRFAFHIDTSVGAGALMCLTSLVVTLVSQLWMRTSGLRDVVLSIAAGLGLIGWVWLTLMVHNLPEGTATLIIYAPIAAFFLVISRMTKHVSALFQLLAMISLVLPAAILLMDHSSFANAMIVVGLGLGLGSWGITQRHKTSFVVGTALVLLGSTCAVVFALSSIEVNTWISLGIGGISLVLLASALERHGRTLVAKVNSHWRQVAEWS